MTDTERVSGTDLKVERTRLRLMAKDVAEAMGVSKGRLSKIEGPELVTPRMRQRYMDALETCRTSGTAA